MSLDEDLEKLGLALDDHYEGYQNLVSSVEDTEDAQEALSHLAEIAELRNTRDYSSEQVVKGVTDYLLDNREHMDDRALELKNNQDRLEEVLDEYNGENTFSRRKLLAGGAGILATGGILGLLWPDGSNNQGALEASINDINEVESYLEQEVAGNQMLEDEWSDLLSNYEDGELFPGEDIQIQSLDIVYDERPGEDSGYRINSSLPGSEDEQLSYWYEFEHDETAEKALQYFGEL